MGRPSGYVDPQKALQAAAAAQAALDAFQRNDMAALQAAGAAGANLQGLNLPAHIVNPTGLVMPAPAPVAAAMPAVVPIPPPAPPPVHIDGLSAVPTTCVAATGFVTAEVLKDDELYRDVSCGPGGGTGDCLVCQGCLSASHIIRHQGCTMRPQAVSAWCV